MPGAPFLRGENLTLRTIEPEDHNFLHRYWHDPDIRDGAVRRTSMRTEDIAEFVHPNRGVHFVVCLDGTPIGTAILIDVFQEAGNGLFRSDWEQDHQETLEIAYLASVSPTIAL